MVVGPSGIHHTEVQLQRSSPDSRRRALTSRATRDSTNDTHAARPGYPLSVSDSRSRQALDAQHPDRWGRELEDK